MIGKKIRCFRKVELVVIFKKDYLVVLIIKRLVIIWLWGVRCLKEVGVNKDGKKGVIV